MFSFKALNRWESLETWAQSCPVFIFDPSIQQTFIEYLLCARCLRDPAGMKEAEVPVT